MSVSERAAIVALVAGQLAGGAAACPKDIVFEVSEVVNDADKIVEEAMRRYPVEDSE